MRLRLHAIEFSYQEPRIIRRVHLCGWVRPCMKKQYKSVQRAVGKRLKMKFRQWSVLLPVDWKACCTLPEVSPTVTTGFRT